MVKDDANIGVLESNAGITCSCKRVLVKKKDRNQQWIEDKNCIIPMSLNSVDSKIKPRLYLEISKRSMALYGFFEEWKKTLPKATHQCDLHDHAL